MSRTTAFGIPPHPRQHGRSLVEVMVAMVIALIALAAVLFTVSGSSLTGQQQDVQSVLNEESAIATGVLSGHLRLAGYSTPAINTVNMQSPERNFFVIPQDAETVPPINTILLQNLPVFACENGFVNPSANTNFPLPSNCAGGGANSAPDAFAIRFEGTADNTQPTAAGLPTDCLGQGVAANTPSSTGQGNYSLIENRFFIALDAGVPSLYCAGSGAFGNPQPIIRNVTDMQVTYGISGVSTPANGSVPLFTPTRYLRADEVNSLVPGSAEAGWLRVVSVRVCLLMQSEAGALSQSMAAYTNCRGTRVTPAATDRRLYRTVNMTVTLRQRGAPCSLVTAVTGLPNQNPSLCS